MLGRKPLDYRAASNNAVPWRGHWSRTQAGAADEPLAKTSTIKLRERAAWPRSPRSLKSRVDLCLCDTEPKKGTFAGREHGATLWEGRIPQFGLTPVVYASPFDATNGACSSSDPPMNFLKHHQAGGHPDLGDARKPRGIRQLQGTVGDGRYGRGLPAQPLELSKQSAGRAGKLRAKLKRGPRSRDPRRLFTLITNGENWVGLVHGVKTSRSAAPLNVYLDPKTCLYSLGRRRHIPWPPILCGSGLRRTGPMWQKSPLITWRISICPIPPAKIDSR